MGRNEIAQEPPAEAPPGVKPPRDWRRIIPGLIISAIALAALLYFVDLKRLLEALRHANYVLVSFSFLTTLLWLVVRTNVWRTLLSDRAPFGVTFFTLNEGYLINNILPLRLGEVARAFLLSKKTNLGFWEVLSSILIERSMDLAMAVGLLLVALPFVVGGDWAQNAAIAAGGMVAAIFAVLYLVARNRQWTLQMFDRISQRLPILERLFGRAVPQFIAGLEVLTQGGRFLRAVGWMLVNWAVAVLQYFVVLRAFYPDAKPLWAAFSLGVSALGVAAPSSPGALGVMELSVVGSLAVFGLEASKALAVALTLHLVQYLTTGIIGAYALFRDGESLFGLYDRIRGIKDDDSPEQAP